MNHDTQGSDANHKEPLLCCSIEPEQLSRMNASVRSIFESKVVIRNPAAIPPSPINDMFFVFDHERRRVHQIMIHRIDYRARRAPGVGSVVIFSEREYAPHRAPMLKLGTPSHYRDSHQLKAGIQDPQDGLLKRDLTPWAADWAKQGAPSVNVRSASISFAAVSEPWIRCASHYRSTTELRRLRDHFSSSYGYTDATAVHDPAGFALRLGIECALQLDKRSDVKLSAIERFVYEQSSCRTDLWEGSHPIDTFFNVYHGPVHYTDYSGRVTTQEEWSDPFAGPMAWFTKEPDLQDQSEYRFAVSTLGRPVEECLLVGISPELRALTAALRS